MNLTNDCLICIVRGSLDAAKLATDDKGLQQQIVKSILRMLGDVNMDQPPPMMALAIQQAVKQVTGVDDPYADLKRKYNDFAMTIFPTLKDKVGNESFEAAARMCIAGNIIDFGTHTNITEQTVWEAIDHALSTSVKGSVAALERACQKADRILWIADNTGEIVLDKLLLSRLDLDRVIVAVRGGPTQNDATVADARYTGLTDLVSVIDTGAAIPGVVLDLCSDRFKDMYHTADLIIAKGQGNFETLDMNDDRIFFLFKAKCPVVADHAGCRLGDAVILQGGKEYGTDGCFSSGKRVSGTYQPGN